MNKESFIKKKVYQSFLLLLLSIFFFVFSSQAVVVSLYVSPSAQFNQNVISQLKRGRSFRPRKNVPIICTDNPPDKIFCINENPVKKKEFQKPNTLMKVFDECNAVFDEVFFVDPKLPKELLGKLYKLLKDISLKTHEINDEIILNSKLSVAQKEAITSILTKHSYYHAMDFDRDFNKQTESLINTLQQYTLTAAMTTPYTNLEEGITEQERRLINSYMDYENIPKGLFFTKHHIVEQRYIKNLIYLEPNLNDIKKYGNPQQYSSKDWSSNKLPAFLINNPLNIAVVPNMYHKARNTVDKFEYNHTRKNPIKTLLNEGYKCKEVRNELSKFKNKSVKDIKKLAIYKKNLKEYKISKKKSI